MNPATTPAPGMRLFYLDDVGVLFSQATQELHLLNPTAALIWSLLEEGNDEPAIVDALYGTYELDEATSRQFASAALGEWRAKGFLGELASAPEDAAKSPPAPPREKGPPWPGPATHEVRRYRILGSHFTIRFSSEAQVQVVHPVLVHLEANAGPPAATPTQVDVVEAPGRLLVYRDRELFAASPGIDALAPIVKSLVWTTAVRDQRFFLNIHAGVVSDGTRCILLPAAPGSGKSTLTAALVHAGYEFFSDEVALLEDRTLDVFPVPLALCVKDYGIEALADRFPQLRSLAIHRRGDGKRVAYMPPPARSRPASEEARPVGALIFPRFTPGGGTSLAPLPRSEALQRLMTECIGVSETLDTHRVEALVRWIAGIPCYALRHASTDDAIAAVASVFGAPARLDMAP